MIAARRRTAVARAAGVLGVLGSMLLARDKASGYSHSELNAAVAPPVQ